MSMPNMVSTFFPVLCLAIQASVCFAQTSVIGTVTPSSISMLNPTASPTVTPTTVYPNSGSPMTSTTLPPTTSYTISGSPITILPIPDIPKPSPIFYLNSGIPSIWHNNDSTNTTISTDNNKVRVVLSRQSPFGFVCGFYCSGSCNSYLFSVLSARNGGHIDLVWSANRQYPVGENANLQLTRDGDLVLKDSDGSKVWSTNTSGNSVQGMNMTDAGNLILFNYEGGIIWQSFDHPTDTLLVGQRLYEGQKLIAASSATNWSHGIYYATFTSSIGFAAFVGVGQNQSLMYYQLAPDQSSRYSSSSNYAVLENGGFLVKLGGFEVRAGSNVTGIICMRLNSDGHLKIYQFRETLELIEVDDVITAALGECQHPLQCGENGVCRQGQCSCPEGQDGEQYFRYTQFQLPNNGCSRITPLSCHPMVGYHQGVVEIRNVSYFNVIDSDTAFPMIKDLENCKLACLQNCSCAGAFFRYETNLSDGYCHMPPKILSMRESIIPKFNFTTATFIKVQIPNVSPNTPQQEGLIPENSPASPPTGKQTNLTAIVGGSIAGAFVIGLVIVIVLVKSQKHKDEADGEDSIKQVLGTPMKFSYEDLRVATGDFSERLGSGGFGSVFKGVLADGNMIAVKRLDKMGQGMREFLAEVETIGSIHHYNLVRLIGYCAERTSRLLVYEYMTNGSLDKWIFCTSQHPFLDWQTRKKIILDVAKGLAYLHEECRQRIVHLDIKPQNILLDEQFNAKVSDFGLSTLFDRDKSQVLATMRGTPGYLAPEWRQLRISIKADIYSFGIVLLEVVCARRNLDRSRSESSLQLLRVLQKKAAENQLIDIVENLNEDMQNHREEVVRLIKLGAWCLQDDPTRRPLMSVVVKVLEGVMEVDQNIIFKFSQVVTSPAPATDILSSAPEPSFLSGPR